MKKFDSISHFLETGGFDYQIFDMGRKLMPISNNLFQQIENQQQVYPYPFLQKAWIALLFWVEESGLKKNPVIWFLQFPIDEIGFLKQDARDGFLIGLLEQAGKNIQAKQQGEVIQDSLDESPFAFKPQADRLAMFHALATNILEQPPSSFYQFAHDYLGDKEALDKWQLLGLQGIADVVARLDYDDNEQLLANALAYMPSEPLQSYCRLLENIKLPSLLSISLKDRFFEVLKDDQAALPLQSMLLRACSGIQSDEIRQKILLQVLDSSIGKEIEILAAISGRSWTDLCNEEIMKIFIENLATQDQLAFNAIVADLMMLPKMRGLVMQRMRDPKRSSQLSLKLNAFMTAIKG